MEPIKSRIMHTIPVSFEDWCEFKPPLRSPPAATQSPARKPKRLKFIRLAKPHWFARLRWKKGKTVASFGAVNLIRHCDGRWELRGGSPKDHAAAREWCSVFQHEATFTGAPLPGAAKGPRASNVAHPHKP
jgi:hypothetical protein